MPARAGRDLIGQFLSPATSPATERAVGTATEAADVSRAANLLGVSEFNVFMLARTQQRGVMAQSDDVAPVFSRYLKRGEVAAWATAYVTRVIAASRQPDFDARRFGGLRAPFNPAEERQFEFWNLAILIGAVAACWLLTHI